MSKKKPSLKELVLGGLLESVKSGGDWDVYADGHDWRIQPSFDDDPKPIVEAVRFGEDGEKVAKKRRFRISIEEI